MVRGVFFGPNVAPAWNCRTSTQYLGLECVGKVDCVLREQMLSFEAMSRVMIVRYI